MAASEALAGADTLPERILGFVAVAILGLIGLVARLVQLVANGLVRLVRSSRIAAVVCAVACVVLVAGLIDTGLTWNKVYDGVKIGAVDVSGMTADEAKEAVRAAYQERFDASQVLIFADETLAASADVEQQIVQDEALAEQISFEEAQKSKRLWVATPRSLNATLPIDALVDRALAVGRDDGGLFGRISAQLLGRTLDMYAVYGEDELEELAGDIDTSIGNPRVDYNIAIENGVATVTEGHDGLMIDRNTLRAKLDAALLGDDPSAGSFVAECADAPLRISQSEAQATANAVNSLIKDGACFTHDGREMSVSAAELGSWVTTDIVEDGGGCKLNPSISNVAATPTLVALVNQDAQGQAVSIDIEVGEEGAVTVTPRNEITVPVLAVALAKLDENLFGAYRASGSTTPDASAIDIATQTVSGPLTFEEACSYGIVTQISSFTTLYTNTDSTQNRNHNIHLAAELLDYSVCESDGGIWSFNGTTGYCNEEAGFLPAGAISGGQYIDAAGGGICQVATTVFNAVFEAGYAVPSRTNHSLYIASYPAGRDAAVSYPELDFTWRNDTSSDVLMRTSYTDTSVTVTLYGVDPGYVVTSETGAWEEGEKHSTQTIIDDTLAPGTSYTKTAGTDGLEITVYRTVRAKDGSLVRQDSFWSVYAPVTEVIMKGPDADEDAAETDAGTSST